MSEKLASEKDHEIVNAEDFRNRGTNIYQDCFGVIVMGKPNCTPPIKMFGSELSHSEFISLEIKSAEINRTASKDWIHPQKTLMSIRMTKNQWSDLVSSFGQGCGTPVTIEHMSANSYPLKRCEEPNVESKFEFRHTYHESNFKVIADRVLEAEELIDNSKLSQKDKVAIKNKLLGLHQMMGSNFEFYRKVLREDVEDVVIDAKRNLESYASTLGIPKDVVSQIAIKTESIGEIE